MWSTVRYFWGKAISAIWGRYSVIDVQTQSDTHSAKLRHGHGHRGALDDRSALSAPPHASRNPIRLAHSMLENLLGGCPTETRKLWVLAHPRADHLHLLQPNPATLDLPAVALALDALSVLALALALGSTLDLALAFALALHPTALAFGSELQATTTERTSLMLRTPSSIGGGSTRTPPTEDDRVDVEVARLSVSMSNMVSIESQAFWESSVMVWSTRPFSLDPGSDATIVAGVQGADAGVGGAGKPNVGGKVMMGVLSSSTRLE